MTFSGILWSVGLMVLAIPCIGDSLYLLVATLLSWAPKTPARSSRELRFDVIVPAHNEAQLIGRTVASLQRLDWPADRFRLIVVADNCSDMTADVARRAGALIIERQNASLRGKGYALNFAFEKSRAEGWADAVVVVDADSEVSPNMLEAFASRLQAGAQVVQSDYGVLNPLAGWRTRLMAIALGSFHVVRSRAREHLKLSCGIRGNGWCVTHQLLQQLPYQAFSQTEDIEYGIDLGLAGHRVYYADEAKTYGEMVTQASNAGDQRQRWERGRFSLIGSRALPLLVSAFRLRSGVNLDLALDLLVLPLSYVAANIAVLTLAAGLGTAIHAVPMAWLGLAAGCWVALVLYVLRGWQLSVVGWRGLVDLAFAPVYIVWKVSLLAKSRAPAGWVRTNRELK